MRKGWFKVEGVQDGDRTVEQQMKGLAPALELARGRFVLDLGSAEGLVAREFAVAGASEVIGCDWVRDHVHIGRALVRGFPVTLLEADLNEKATHNWISGLQPNIVLMLAILHKLREPGVLVRTVARLQPELIVVRLPPETAPVIIDKRSGNRPCNVQTNMEEHGYRLASVDRGHFDEWVGYFSRPAA